jgi:hypothetical protein
MSSAYASQIVRIEMSLHTNVKSCGRIQKHTAAGRSRKTSVLSRVPPLSLSFKAFRSECGIGRKATSLQLPLLC